jgi:hypothetical protein
VNVTLRQLDASDDAWLESWLAPVAISVGYDGVHPERAASSLRRRLRIERTLDARIFERDGEPAGVLIYKRIRRGSAAIQLVATPPALARRGSAMRAMALLEEELRASRVHAVFAASPAMHGIAMYFWIRLGYRPLLRAEWPCEREGVAWLRRDIAPA